MNSFLLLCDVFSFVFWKKLKTPNRHFEIIWLLVRQESFVYKICMKFVWDWSIVFQIDNIILKHNETISNKLMAIHFAHDCVEMVRCSSVFRMSSIFAETSVSRTKKNLEGKLKSHVHTHLAVTTCSVVRDSTRFLCSAALNSPSTGYSFWDWLHNFLHNFFLSVHNLNKLGKFW